MAEGENAMKTRLAAACAASCTLAIAAAPAAAAPDDPLYAEQWGPQQVRAEAAWTTSTGSGAIIGVVDSGVDFDHPDLAGKLLQGATFLDCGASSCGNGDWESGPAERQELKSTHGTHVSGIAAAATGNGIGIAGVAPAARVLPVKVLDEDGGSFEDIAAGIRYSVDHGASVVNLSLGALPGAQALTFTGVISDVQEAIAYARERGVVVVAAAGNDFVAPLCGTPAFDAGALCVVSTDKREARSAFSNFALNQELDAVAAPGGSLAPVCGEDVVSTVPLGTGTSTACGYGTDYDEYAGTSMATPHVAGVAALLAAQGRTDENIMSVLETTARQPGTGLRGTFDPVYGYGIVDADAAVAAPGAATTIKRGKKRP
jgi:subtilisin family serine protease